MRVVVTGASGVLGRAVAHHFQQKGDTVLPLSFSRPSSSIYPDLPKFVTLDLLDKAAISDYLKKEGKIDALIHCAAERRPDVAEKDPERAEKLNKDVVRDLAGLCNDMGICMVYISTDYVFDGQKPPYHPQDKTNPLQFYGRTKALGEEAILESRRAGVAGKGCIVLRVPILYGEVEYNAETAVNILVDVIEDASKQTKMDHFAVRFPTNVEDVARVCYDLTHLGKPLPPIVHYSSQKPYTKYEMTQIIAKAMGADISHVIPDTTDPSTLPPPADGKAPTPRPGNTQLSVKETEELGINVKEGKSFEEWWTEWAKRHAAKKGGKDAYALIEDLVARYPLQAGALYTSLTDLALSQQWHDIRSHELNCGWAMLSGRKADTDPIRFVLPLAINADNLTPAVLKSIFTELNQIDYSSLPPLLPSLLDDEEPRRASAEAPQEVDKESIYISIVTPDSSTVYYRLTKGIKKPSDVPDE